MKPPAEVAARAPRCEWYGVSGGFSGAKVWRGEIGGTPAFALKRWPKSEPPERLRQVHGWMTAASVLPFVPKILAFNGGDTVLSVDGNLFTFATWMRGEPALSHPTSELLERACRAVVDLHRQWEPVQPEFAPCPAVARRLALFDDYERSPPILQDALHKEAAAMVKAGLPIARRELEPWRTKAVPVQTVLCDLHREHVLFVDGEVSAILDYGAMKRDNPAVDAARLLGDAVGDNEPLYETGLAIFAEAGVDAELARVLDRSGTIGGIVHWLMRGAVAEPERARLSRLLERGRRLFTGRMEPIDPTGAAA